jgi:hypothetical protein
MLLGKNTGIKETIIHILGEGRVDSTELLKRISGEKKVSKQGFYKALRELVAEEVVAKNKQLLVLNNMWVNKMQAFIASIDANYKSADEFLGLEEGESLVYHFKNLASLDVLWMHYFYIIAKKETNEPIIFYNAHEFWSLFRFNEENAMYEWIGNESKTTGRKVYEIIGSNTAMDRETTGYMKKYGIELAYEDKMSFPKNYFTSIIGDYILDTILDANTANAIDLLYKNNPAWNEDVSKQLLAILKNLKRSKVVIYRDKKKAEQLRKKLMKYFVFYKPEKA